MHDNIYTDGTYLSAHPQMHSQDSDWKASHLMRLLGRDLLDAWSRQAQTLRIAEIGCGFGGVLAGVISRLESLGIPCEGTGYDIAPMAVHEARRRYPQLHFVEGDFLARRESYTLGLLVDLLEHLDNPSAFLSAAKERFQVMLIHMPLDEHWFGHLYYRGRYYEYLREDRGHLWYFTRRRATALLKEAGLTLRTWVYTPWSVELQQSGGGPVLRVVQHLRGLGFACLPGLTVRTLGGASLACLCEHGAQNMPTQT